MVRISFTQHPASVGETYSAYANRLAPLWRMQLAALACFVHGIFPFLLTKTGSTSVSELYSRMVQHRSRL
ncbi:DUF6356 family protein [Bradyrhizobium septentrionale]|nr:MULTISPECIES: DUF6356 family protein [Bradyrhizobium]MCK7672540.1 DUF6356 family protein [Bradyrhizobium sp. 2S1]UGY20653.1 DUF6356 family protein [Bradyrhizobium septentrionale]UGY29421.1 DUF6356 family protein [Bradyrhizobium septentrionale]